MLNSFCGRIKEPMTEEENKRGEKSLEGDADLALQPHPEMLPATEFVKVEKNLAALGFFTPSSKRSRNATAKTVTVTVALDGRRIEARATIAPTALFGLPITADQDKWLALHKILTDVQTREGEVHNPVSFSSAELLALLKIYKDSGKNYKDVSDWLDVMVGTTIISEGAVYISGQRTFKKDTFHVFDRAVSFGRQLPDGSIADKNYVWLSEWQLKNINDHHQLPIDLDSYRQLRNHIAKALVPLLQVWLYASRDEGVFEKRYDELCQILSIRQYQYLSIIKQTLSPSLDELKRFAYIADWQVEKTSDGQNYKIIFFHGEKFHRDRRARLQRKQSSESAGEQPQSESQAPRRVFQRALKLQPAPSETTAQVPAAAVPVTSQNSQNRGAVDPQLAAVFHDYGITEKKTRELLANLKPGQTHEKVLAQLELAHDRFYKTPGKYDSYTGFLVSFVRDDAPIPSGFETKAQRKAREERERRRAEEELVRLELENEYAEYRDREIDRFIASLDLAEVEAVHKAKRHEAREQHQSEWVIDNVAKIAARHQLAERTPLLTIEEFKARREQVMAAAPESVSSEPVAAPEEQLSVPSFLLKPVADLAAVSTLAPIEAAPVSESVPPDDIPPGEAGNLQTEAITSNPEDGGGVSVADAAPAAEPEPEANPAIPTATIEPTTTATD